MVKDKIKTVLLAIWVIIPLFLYLHNFNYLWLSALAAVLAGFFFVLIKFSGHLSRGQAIRPIGMQKILIDLLKSEKLEIRSSLLISGWLALVLINISALASAGFSWKNTMPENIIPDLIFAFFSLIGRVGNMALFLFLFLLIPTALGKISIRRILPVLNKTDGYLTGFAFGLSFIMLTIFFLALAGWLYRLSIVAMLFLSVIISHNEIIALLKIKFPKTITIRTNNSFEIYRALVIGIIAISMSLLFTYGLKLVPTDGDSLHVYFSAPLAYASEHRFLPLDYSVHANMGQNIEMIYAGIIASGATAPINILNWLALSLIIIVAYFLAKQIFDGKTAALAAMFSLLLPMNIYFVYTAKTDLWLAFYLLLIVHLFFIWQKNKSRSIIMAIGWLSGIAIGIKYTSIIFLFAIYLVFFIENLIKDKKSCQKIFVSFLFSVLFALASFLPWGIKNIYFFQAPFHPLPYFSIAEKVENNEEKSLNEYAEKRSDEVVKLKHGYEPAVKNPLNIIGTIWRQSTGHEVLPALSHNFGWLPFIMIIPLFFSAKREPIRKLLLIAIISTIIWHLAGNGGAWYLYFVIVILYILTAEIFRHHHGLAWLSLSMMAIIFYANAPIASADDWLFHKKTDKNIISEAIPDYDAVNFFNDLNPGKNKKLLVVGTFAIAYIDNPKDTIDSIDPYFALVGALLQNGEADLIEYLKKNNIGYLLFSDLYNVYQAWPQFQGTTLDAYRTNYTGEIPSIYEDIDKFLIFLENSAVKRFEKNGYRIYGIK